MKTIDIFHRLVFEFECSSIEVENSGAGALGAAVMAISFLRNRRNNSDQTWPMALSAPQEHIDRGLLVGITCIKTPGEDLISFRQVRNSLVFRDRMECRKFGPLQ
jgi:hypothetical protein